MDKFTANTDIDMMEKLYQTEDQSVVHLKLTAGKEVPEHDTPARAFIIPISGKVSFSSPEKTYEIVPGDVIHLEPKEAHWLKAIEESHLIVVKVNV